MIAHESLPVQTMSFDMKFIDGIGGVATVECLWGRTINDREPSRMCVCVSVGEGVLPQENVLFPEFRNAILNIPLLVPHPQHRTGFEIF